MKKRKVHEGIFYPGQMLQNMAPCGSWKTYFMIEGNFRSNIENFLCANQKVLVFIISNRIRDYNRKQFALREPEQCKIFGRFQTEGSLRILTFLYLPTHIHTPLAASFSDHHLYLPTLSVRRNLLPFLPFGGALFFTPYFFSRFSSVTVH